MPPMASLPTPAAEPLREAASFNIRAPTTLENGQWLNRDSRRQQFGLQFLGSARGKLTTQEQFDFSRLGIEQLGQDLRVVPLPGQPGFQLVNIPGEHVSIISASTGFWPTL
jgi:hypothetical protein